MTQRLRAPPQKRDYAATKFSSTTFLFRAPPKKSNKEKENFVSAFCPKWAGGGDSTLAGEKFPSPFNLPLFARSPKCAVGLYKY